jgi:hypothetical protein
MKDEVKPEFLSDSLSSFIKIEIHHRRAFILHPSAFILFDSKFPPPPTFKG